MQLRQRVAERRRFGRVGRRQLRWPVIDCGNCGCQFHRRLRPRFARAEQRCVEIGRRLLRAQRHAGLFEPLLLCRACRFLARHCGWRAAGRSLRQRLVQRMEQETVHRLRLAETHFDLGRMHVDIHQLRRQFQKQRKTGMPIVMQHIAIGFADCVADQLVAHETAVDVEKLRIATAFGYRRRTGYAPQPQAVAVFFHRQGAVGKLVAEQGFHPLRQRLAR